MTIKQLREGIEYSLDYLDDIFNFDYKKPSGIKTLPLGYPCLRIIRLSLLLGQREEFRLGEKIGVLLVPVLKPFMMGSLKKYAPVEAESVAHFMVKVAHEKAVSVYVYESDLIG